MSILKWDFKANMDKALSSDDNGQIALANGCELAFISLLVGESDFRNPESFPCLHDKVLAAAADAAINFSANQKKKQKTAPGILGGIAKGFKGGKGVQTLDPSAPSSFNYTHLEHIFSRSPFGPFSDPSPATTDEEVVELNIAKKKNRKKNDERHGFDVPYLAYHSSKGRIRGARKAESRLEFQVSYEEAEEHGTVG